MMREKIRDLIEKAVKTAKKQKKLLVFEIPCILVEKPEEKAHGDYASNISLQLAKPAKKDPMEIVDLLSSELRLEGKKFFDKIEAVKPGFINFFLSKEYLHLQLKEILKQKENFGQLKLGKNKKVQVEFISANPTGPLTVGNARGGPFGDVLGNVLKKSGFKVEKAFYINDYGVQVISLGHSVLKDKEAKYQGEYIDYLNKRIKEKDPYKAGQLAAKIITEEMIRKTTDKMGIKYDEWLSELTLHESGRVDKALNVFKKKGLIYEKDKAQWFQSTKYGDERDRVLIKSDGRKTYLAGDIAYHRYKFKEKKFDKVINVWGADHYGDVPGLQAAIEVLGHKGKLDIILLQFVTIIQKGKGMKMSKRKGVYVTMDELLAEVGPDIARFFFLQKSADTHLNFDFSLAKKQTAKNPLYYVQYAHARICSILKKAAGLKALDSDLHLLTHDSESSLIKQLIRFPEIVEDSAKDYQLQRIPQYAIDLATSFHQFYRDCKVLTEDKSLSKARLALIFAAKTLLKNTLDLMGISSPEKM